MPNAHFKFWPSHAMHNLIAPATNLFYNAEVSARRYPNKPYLVFYDTPISFAEFHDEANRIAGYLQQVCGVAKGDRVMLLMQNSPQFMIGYYGILRADAVVVPLNPMNITPEILKFSKDAGSDKMLVSQELYARVEPLLKSGDVKQAIVAAYSDYLKAPTQLAVPDFIAAARVEIKEPGVTLWKDVIAQNLKPGPLTAGPDDLAVMPYTS
ncbi:MAG: fatty-acyl-CoA synthase, partial [Gammaproteobacteria bacterium]|nr:fatty-acyl-CoA synthase [Gammaproteobacteria bacterium]